MAKQNMKDRRAMIAGLGAMAAAGTFADADTMTYETTIDDPTVFTRPWTMRAVEKRKAEYEFWENACHEGERSVEGMLLAK